MGKGREAQDVRIVKDPEKVGELAAFDLRKVDRVFVGHSFAFCVGRGRECQHVAEQWRFALKEVSMDSKQSFFNLGDGYYHFRSSRLEKPGRYG